MSCRTYDPCLDSKLNQIGSYASVARQSAQSATASAAAADSDATAAAASAAAAAASAEIAGIYLGPFATPPTVDNQGGPLQEGMLYYNTANNTLFVWNGSSWSAIQDDEIYLGGFAAAPVLNNQGLPLVSGNLYWNNVTNNLWAYNGVAWIVTNFNETTPFLATGTTFARTLANRFADVVNVLDFGADPTGVVNSATFIQNAINYANSSLTKKFVFIPSGRYKISSQLQTYSNITISGDSNGSTIFDYSTQTSGDFIYTTPTIGSPIAISSNIGRYDTSVSTVSPHGAAVGDKYALLSQRNALSVDGGDWQLGIGTGSLKASYYSEILNVKIVNDLDTFEFYPPLVFPDYNTSNSAETPNTTRVCNIPTVALGDNAFTITLASGNTTGLVEGMTVTGTGIPTSYIVRISAIISSTQIRMYSSSDAGLTATSGTTLSFTINSRANSDIRKVTFVKNPIIQNIKFISGTGTNKINFYGVSDGLIKNCDFSLNSVGEAINYINCYNTKSVGCSVYYTAGIATTFTYNPLSNISSWNCGYEDCKLENAFQGFDVTYSSGIFGSGIFSPSMFAYVDRCISTNCENGMTSHSGSYGVKVTNNQFLYCNTGIFLRSPNSLCANNFITGTSNSVGTGIGLINYAWESLISNNTINNFKSGITISPGVGELGFGIKNVKTNILNNIISQTKTAITITGSDDYHKSSDLMNIIISNNTITNSDFHIYLREYANGVSIVGNNFIGQIVTYCVYVADNVFSINIRDNIFSDIGTALPIFVGTLTDLTAYPTSGYKYDTNMVYWSGNKFFGDTIGSQAIFGLTYDPNIDNKYVDSGSYIPTIANQTNVNTVTLGQSSFCVKDRMCIVSGRITISATTSGLSATVKLNTPIPTDVSVLNTNATINGTAIANDLNGQVSAKIGADVTDNTAILNFLAEDTLGHEFRYIYQYPIL